MLQSKLTTDLRLYPSTQILPVCLNSGVDLIQLKVHGQSNLINTYVELLPDKGICLESLLNPLDSPHHMRIDEESDYREGVVVDRPTKQNKGSFVDCGMRKEVQIDKQLQPGLRVTVRLSKTQNPEGKAYKGVVVAPHVPRSEGGYYWGYSVRLASCLSAVFTESPFKGGYDLTIGTSERGSNADQASLTPFKHLLVVFGGLQGLEASLDADQKLDVTDPSVLFDLYLNTCPGQGSRTIRTEEAILISMAALRPKITAAVSSSSASLEALMF
uniref:28S rRNA (uridine-N(3))-methyltransferase n=2 Tax=Neolamprologus brichardi TaxID=32507 RepID=A0A3Q4MGX9_NEOBR